MAVFTKQRVMLIILGLTLTCSALSFSAMTYIPLWKSRHSGEGIYLVDVFKTKKSMTAAILWLLMSGCFLISLLVPINWFFGATFAQWAYEKATGVEFGSEWIAGAFRDKIFSSMLSSLTGWAWWTAAMVWYLEEKDETLAWGWGCCVLTGLLASNALISNLLYPFLPDDERTEDAEASPEGGFWWGGTSSEAERQPIYSSVAESGFSSDDEKKEESKGWFW
mmetsp:Transcript_65520/g.140149  ORF Transcript_65520/g.140149 Transcript_65520/m.140149 type:complete len:222 (-) Transcript_65520:58-723(-)